MAGTSIFIGSSVIPSVDTPTTGVVFLTGDATLTTDRGTLLTKDAISLSTAGNGEFGEVISIVGGTSGWAGYTGKVTATGTFINGSGAGAYTGEICNFGVIPEIGIMIKIVGFSILEVRRRNV